MSFENIEKLESTLWEAADQLRANSKLTSSEYCMPVLGVIFLRHATNRYNAALASIKSEQAAGATSPRPLVKADFLKRRALMLPPEAQYDELLRLPSDSDLGRALIAAMDAIEEQFEPLQGQLPKDYERFEPDVLETLVRIFDREELRSATGDVFGRIYEYFLMKFAMQGAQDNGEFFTPPSIVQTLVNVIEPDHGTIFDPACGSGGMFVQSSHFVELQGQDPSKTITFYGQEKTATTIRLAKMNLAVHGLEGDIREANTFYEDEHGLIGSCNFVMANPPFNVDMVDAEKVKGDARLPFGLPGVNKSGKVSNGNYLWISYFHSYLANDGRAGFVMSSQASTAGRGEAEVRKQLIRTGDVDVMIGIRPNFFYTRTVPCELWFFDRGKPDSRRRNVLMIDARQVFRKVSRRIVDFSPDQAANLTAIVWLYRGQTDRFIELIGEYFSRAVEAAPSAMSAFDSFVSAADVVDDLLATSKQDERVGELRASHEALCADMNDFRAAAKHASVPKLDNGEQRKASESLEALAERARGLLKQIDATCKLRTAIAATARQLGWGEAGRAATSALKDLDYCRASAADALKDLVQAHKSLSWLQDRFPEAEIADVPGLCKVVTIEEIEAADWSLSPGRYVGVAPAQTDDDFDFEEALSDLHAELDELNAEAEVLAREIQESFEGVAL